MQTFQDLIARWDTLEAFRIAVGVPYQRARKWRDRNNIPPEYWSAVVAACRASGVTGISPVKLMEFASNTKRERA